MSDETQTLRDMVVALREQRDQALNALAFAQARIAGLSREITILNAAKKLRDESDQKQALAACDPCAGTDAASDRP